MTLRQRIIDVLSRKLRDFGSAHARLTNKTISIYLSVPEASVRRVTMDMVNRGVVHSTYDKRPYRVWVTARTYDKWQVEQGVTDARQ